MWVAGSKFIKYHKGRSVSVKQTKVLPDNLWAPTGENPSKVNVGHYHKLHKSEHEESLRAPKTQIKHGFTYQLNDKQRNNRKEGKDRTE